MWRRCYSGVPYNPYPRLHTHTHTHTHKHTHTYFDCLRLEKTFIHGPKRVRHTRNNTLSYDIDIIIIIIIITTSIIIIICVVVDLLRFVVLVVFAKHRQIVSIICDIMETYPTNIKQHHSFEKY